MKVSYVTDASRDKLLAELMEKTGVKTKQAMIDNTIVAFDWLVEQKQKGCLVISTDNTGVEKELVMPVLSAVKREVKTSDLTDQEKSVILAKAMGWKVIIKSFDSRMYQRGPYSYEVPFGIGRLIDDKSNPVRDVRGFKREPLILWREQENEAEDQVWKYRCANFYHPADAFLAWQVHLWALSCEVGNVAIYYDGWWHVNEIWKLPDAQRAWLDKILSLINEMEVENE